MAKLRPGDPAPDFTATDMHGRPVTLLDLRKRPTALVFSRYLGCPVCQLHTAELRRAAPRFDSAGGRLVVVYQSSPERLAEAFGEDDPGFLVLSDPGAELYDLYGVGASVLGFLHPGSLAGAVKATMKGRMHGRFEGRETQLPADFVIDPSGKLVYVHYGAHIDDSSSPDKLLRALPAPRRTA